MPEPMRPLPYTATARMPLLAAALANARRCNASIDVAAILFNA